MTFNGCPETTADLLSRATEGLGLFCREARLGLGIPEILNRLEDLLDGLDLNSEKQSFREYRRLVAGRRFLREEVRRAVKEGSVEGVLAINSRLDPLLQPTAWELTADRTPPGVPLGELFAIRGMWADVTRRVSLDLEEAGFGIAEIDHLKRYTEEFIAGVNPELTWSLENARFWEEAHALSSETGFRFFEPTRQRQANLAASDLVGDDELPGLIDRLEAGIVEPDDLTRLLDRILGGNAEDLLVSDSHRQRVKAGSRNFRWALDGREVAFDALLHPADAVALHLDNLGSELVFSMLLAVLLVKAGAGKVVLMSKPYPFNLSDACPPDIESAVRGLIDSEEDILVRAGNEIRKCLETGELHVADGPLLDFEASGHTLSEMPAVVDDYLKKQGVTLEVFFGEGFRGVVQGLGRWPLTASAKLLQTGPDGVAFSYPRKVIVIGKIKDCTILRGIDPLRLWSIYSGGGWPWEAGGLIGADFVELLDLRSEAVTLKDPQSRDPA